MPSTYAPRVASQAGAVITRIRTLDDVADQSIADPRIRAELASLFSALALMLGMLGIYGLMSYTVAQQTRELAIRMALGADRRQLASLLLGKALRLSLAGIGAGLLMAHAVARWLSTLFFGVGSTDLIALSAACALLITAALLAAAYPTRRAVQVDPAAALRNE